MRRATRQTAKSNQTDERMNAAYLQSSRGKDIIAIISSSMHTSMNIRLHYIADYVLYNAEFAYSCLEYFVSMKYSAVAWCAHTVCQRSMNISYTNMNAT